MPIEWRSTGSRSWPVLERPDDPGTFCVIGPGVPRPLRIAPDERRLPLRGPPFFTSGRGVAVVLGVGGKTGVGYRTGVGYWSGVGCSTGVSSSTGVGHRPVP